MNNNKQISTASLMAPGVAVSCVDIDIRKALRIFKDQVLSAGITRKLKDNLYYTKPSDRRRQIIQAAVHKNKFKEN